MITQCKKINTEDENRKQNRNEDVLASTVSGSNSENLICEPTNVDLLGIVLSGSGATVQMDSSTYKFPSYTPPINESGILAFVSMESYSAFSNAIDLLSDLWEDSPIDYEDTPYEIYHLGRNH